MTASRMEAEEEEELRRGTRRTVGEMGQSVGQWEGGRMANIAPTGRFHLEVKK